MAVIRLVLIFVVIGSVTLLVVQNFSPSLAIRFLGMRSQALPLSIWVLMSIVAGALTSLTISSLFQLSSSTTISGKQSSFTPPSSPRPPQPPRERVSVKNPSSQPGFERRVNQNLDEWEQTASEDWDFDDDVVDKTANRDHSNQTPKTDHNPDLPRDRHRNREDFDEGLFEPDQQEVGEPIQKSPSDSTYSYNYREPKQTGVGKTESVYDADYRVLVPPYYPESGQQSPPDNYQENSQNNQNNQDDDWDFLNELDGEDTSRNTKIQD